MPTRRDNQDGDAGKSALLSLGDDAVVLAANAVPRAEVAMSGGGLWSKLLAVGEASGEGALGATVGGALMAPLGLEIGRKVVGSLGTDRLDYMVQGQRQAMMASMAQGLENERLQSLMAINTQRLAQFAPDLYTQVMAGRRLPRGAVVIGGAPRLDLMDELALAMAQGKMRPKPSVADQLSGLM